MQKTGFLVTRLIHETRHEKTRLQDFLKEILVLGTRGIVPTTCIEYSVKPKGLMSCMVTAQLICIFVFAYTCKKWGGGVRADVNEKLKFL